MARLLGPDVPLALVVCWPWLPVGLHFHFFYLCGIKHIIYQVTHDVQEVSQPKNHIISLNQFQIELEYSTTLVTGMYIIHNDI